MKGPKALWLATTLMAVALAGCTSGGGSDGLDMFVTASSDPMTEPFKFKATGLTADEYTWDFGDGIIEIGKEVEHIYGFTNGDITVKLTACTAGECESVLRKVPLGGSKNISPAGSLVANTEWITVGTPITLDATGSSDANGDPILYRWNCARVADLMPPADGGGHSHGPPGVPFGVQALASYDESLSGGDDHGANLCSDFAIENDQPWSRDSGKITGSFATSGLYRIDVFVRDPKSTPWIGRLDLYVSDTMPEPTATIEFSGSLTAGSGGDAQDACAELNEGTCPLTLDRAEHTFTVEIPNALATVSFSAFTLNAANAGGAVWSIKVGEGSVATPSADSPKFLGPLAFINGREYRVIVEIDGAAAQVEYSGQILVEHDLNPRHLFQMPP